MNSALQQQYLEHIDQRPLANKAREAFENHFRAIKSEMVRTGSWTTGLRVLDIGCGIGFYTELFHKRGMISVGVDLDKDLIDRARDRIDSYDHSIQFEIGASDDLPFDDESFDIVFANALLEHVPDWEKAVEEWVRVLAPGGLLWIETTNVQHPRQPEYRWLPLYSWWPQFMKRIVVHLARTRFPALANYAPYPAVNWLSFFKLKRFLELRGMTVRDRFDCMDPAQVSMVKRIVRRVATSSAFGRWLSYFLAPMLIILGRKLESESSNVSICG